MDKQAGRTAILNKIKAALVQKSEAPYPQWANELPPDMYVQQSDDLLISFAEKFTSLQGLFAYCENMQAFAEQLNNLIITRNWSRLYCAEPLLQTQLSQLGFAQYFTTDLANCQASITSVEYLVARTGSMVLSSAFTQGRTASVYAPVHIAIAYSSQVVQDLPDAFNLLQTKYANEGLPSVISFANGPSRTADIEKTLITGVHGPAEVYCFLLG